MNHRNDRKQFSRAAGIGALSLAALAVGLAPGVAAGKGSGSDKKTSDPVSTPSSPAASVPALNTGLIVLNPTTDNALRLNGNGKAHCPVIQVNSTSLAAVSLIGNGKIEASILHVVGDMGADSKAGVIGSIDCDAGVMFDPHSALAVSNQQMGSDKGNIKVAGGIFVASPGYYSGGIKLSGNAQVEFLPGVYYVGGDGLELTSASAVARGVTFVIMQGSVKTAGQSMLEISPSSGGDFNGIAIFQPKNNSTEMHLSGGSYMNLTGTVYAPGARITIVGSGEAVATGSYYGDRIVADTVTLSGQGEIRMGETPAARLPAGQLQCD